MQNVISKESLRIWRILSPTCLKRKHALAMISDSEKRGASIIYALRSTPRHKMRGLKWSLRSEVDPAVKCGSRFEHSEDRQFKDTDKNIKFSLNKQLAR